MFGKEINNKTLGELVITVKRGLSSYYVQKKGIEVPFINIRDVKDGFIDSAAVETVYVKETGALDKSRLEPNDVIISIKGSVFRAAIADKNVKDFLISANLIAFKLNGDVLPEIVVAYLNSPQGQKELLARSAGALQKALNLKSLMEIKIPVPDKKSQKMLADYFLLSKQHTDLMKKEKEIREKLNNHIMLNHMMG